MQNLKIIVLGRPLKGVGKIKMLDDNNNDNDSDSDSDSNNNDSNSDNDDSFHSAITNNNNFSQDHELDCDDDPALVFWS